MRALLLAATLVALTLAGCSSSQTTTSSSSAAPTTSATSSMMMNTTSKTVTVTIQNMAFSPANVTINVGDTIHWVNMDTASAPHSVVADDSSFTSGDCPGTGCLVAGTSAAGTDHYDHKFSKAGTFAYHCGVHPSMKATVTVVGMAM